MPITQIVSGGADPGWHTLLKERSIQFVFPDMGTTAKPPGWLAALLAYLLQHRIWFHYAGWFLLAGLALAGAFFLGRFLLQRDWSHAGVAPPVPPAAWQPSAERARMLLDDADRLAARGHFSEAAHLLLLVSIQEIGERRPGIVLPALTSREIGKLEALSPRARLVFGAIAQVVERCLFGGRALAAADFAQCRRAFEQFTVAESWSNDMRQTAS